MKYFINDVFFFSGKQMLHLNTKCKIGLFFVWPKLCKFFLFAFVILEVNELISRDKYKYKKNLNKVGITWIIYSLSRLSGFTSLNISNTQSVICFRAMTWQIPFLYDKGWFCDQYATGKYIHWTHHCSHSC